MIETKGQKKQTQTSLGNLPEDRQTTPIYRKLTRRLTQNKNKEITHAPCGWLLFILISPFSLWGDKERGEEYPVRNGREREEVVEDIKMKLRNEEKQNFAKERLEEDSNLIYQTTQSVRKIRRERAKSHNL